MDKEATDIRLDQWKQIVLEASNSSLTKREWCQQNGINEKQLFYWQRKIRRLEARKLIGSASDSDNALPMETSSSGFVEMPLSGRPGKWNAISPNEAGDSFSSIVVQVADCRIRIADSVQEATLRTVLSAIRNA